MPILHSDVVIAWATQHKNWNLPDDQTMRYDMNVQKSTDKCQLSPPQLKAAPTVRQNSTTEITPNHNSAEAGGLRQETIKHDYRTVSIGHVVGDGGDNVIDTLQIPLSDRIKIINTSQLVERYSYPKLQFLKEA